MSNRKAETIKRAGESQKEMTMKEIHRPSSLEGAIWSAQGIEDASIIIHAPPGCYMMQHMNSLCNEWQPDMYSTLVSYANVMMGTEDNLEETLRKVISYGPKAVIIVTSPVIEITGDDVEGVVKKVGFEKTAVIRLPLGDSLAEGKEKGFLSLLDMMNPDIKTVEKSVNILGPTHVTFNWRADVFELKRMLSNIGVSVNAVFTADSTIQEIENAPGAALNICMYPFDCGIETAKEMERRFGTPYVADHVPIGFGQSAAWLKEIGEILKVDPKAYIEGEMKSALDFSAGLLVSNTLFESSVALSTDNCDSYSVGISSFLAREMGMDVCMATVGSSEAATQMKEVCDTVIVNPGTDDKKSLFLEKSPTIILGNYYDLKLATDMGFKNFLMADIPHIGYISSENKPFMGFLGAKNLVETIANEIYLKIFIETKGEMEGAISSGEVDWELDAERALGRIAEMLPHFVRSIALKKIHQVADEMAIEKGTRVTLEILKEVTNKYTPTRFKAKYATLFADMADVSEEPDAETEQSEPLNFKADWEDDAKEMLDMVPSEFVQKAIEGTEQYAKEHEFLTITAQVVKLYQKELGF